MTRAVRRARFADLAPATLYAILRLRAEVFVVEQECAYLDPDGRDTEVDAEHLWIEHDGEIVAVLRILRDADAWRLGRIVTAPAVRSHGFAAQLIDAALATVGRPVVIDAQAHLADWYSRFGFAVNGPEFVEDGILHVPMRLI